MTDQNTERPLRIAVIGAGGKMGMRISANLERTGHEILFCEPSPAGRQMLADAGREVSESLDAASRADFVVVAVPDVVLGKVSEELVPVMADGSVFLTLDPAAAYAGQLADKAGVHRVCAHPCHPSVFLERTTPEEYADTFGGVAAPQDVVAAMEVDDEAVRQASESVIRAMYSPVIDVHWVTVRQLAYLEPTLVETIAIMLSDLLVEALDETVNTVGVPEAAAKAMLFGHIQVGLANSLRGSNPFSDACLIAMDYGREALIRDDWKRVFREDELDGVISRMLKLDTGAVE